jgi:hypothetical protein
VKEISNALSIACSLCFDRKQVCSRKTGMDNRKCPIGGYRSQKLRLDFFGSRFKSLSSHKEDDFLVMKNWTLLLAVCLFEVGCSNVKINSKSPSNVLSQDNSYAANQASARKIVERLHSAMLQASYLDFNAACKLIDPVIRSIFSKDITSKLILGRHWDEISDTQKKEFSERLLDLFIASEARLALNSQSFSFKYGQDPRPGEVDLTYLMMSRGGQGDVRNITYELESHGASWILINVYVNSTSIVFRRLDQEWDVLDAIAFKQLLSGLDKIISDFSEPESLNKFFGFRKQFSNEETLRTRENKVSSDVKFRDESLERAKSDCGQLYKAGTKEFGGCVMKLLE